MSPIKYEHPLEGIAVELATSCNLSCKMCSAWKRREPVIAYDKILSLLDEARALGAVRFYSCGTEPFVRDETPEILAYAQRAGFRESCVVSNGLLLNNGQMLDNLAKLRNLNIVISIDGPEDVHDYLRGKGTFVGAVDSLRELRKRGMTCSIASIIMRQTIDRLHEIIDMAAGLGIPVISMQPYQRETAGLERDHSPYEFTKEDEKLIRKKLKSLMRYAELKKVTIYTANIMKYVPSYLALGTAHVPPTGCSIPSRQLVVDSAGDCFPCFMIREHMRNKCIGNIYDMTLDNMWCNDIHRDLKRMALERRCPGCLAACSDIDSYNALAQRGWLARNMMRLIGK